MWRRVGITCYTQLIQRHASYAPIRLNSSILPPPVSSPSSSSSSSPLPPPSSASADAATATRSAHTMHREGIILYYDSYRSFGYILAPDSKYFFFHVYTCAYHLLPFHRMNHIIYHNA